MTDFTKFTTFHAVIKRYATKLLHDQLFDKRVMGKECVVSRSITDDMLKEIAEDEILSAAITHGANRATALPMVVFARQIFSTAYILPTFAMGTRRRSIVSLVKYLTCLDLPVERASVAGAAGKEPTEAPEATPALLLYNDFERLQSIPSSAATDVIFVPANPAPTAFGPSIFNPLIM